VFRPAKVSRVGHLSQRNQIRSGTCRMAPAVVMVTGVGDYLGGNLAARLAQNPDIERVLGVDMTPPPRELLQRMGRAEFVRADIRNPLIAKVISSAKVDTVVNASTTAHPAGPARRTVLK